MNQQDETQERLVRLVRQRQRELMKIRDTGEGDTAQTDQAIRVELSRQGMSEPEIEAFMQQLPQYEGGGMIDEGLYYGHDKEFVMNAKAVAKYGAGLMNSMNNLELPTLSSPAMGYLTQQAMESNARQGIVVNIEVSNDGWQVSGDSRQAQQLARQMEEVIINAVNKGIKSRAINLINGGRV